MGETYAQWAERMMRPMPATDWRYKAYSPYDIDFFRRLYRPALISERSSMERTLTLSSHSASSAIYTGPNGECLVIPMSVFPTDFVSIQLPKSITINAEGGPGTDWEVIPKR